MIHKNMKLIKKSIAEYICDLKVKNKKYKVRIEWFGHIKIKGFCSTKENLSKIEIQ